MPPHWDEWLASFNKWIPFSNVATALAGMITAVTTVVLVGVTAWFMKRQTDRAMKAHSTELFLQLRARAISPDHVARRRRVIALLIHLEERKISTDKLKFSPDINLYLNDYEWRLLLDSRVVDLSMAYTPTFVILSSLKPLFFNSLKNEWRFLDNVGA